MRPALLPIVLLLVACPSKPSGSTGTSPAGPSTGSSTGTPAGTPTGGTVSTAVDALAFAPVDPTNNGLFATGEVCAECHSNSAGASAMRDGNGAEIGMVDLWQATMMANSSRDPLWRTVLSAEVAATPSRQAEIEAKCTRCHAPMGNEDAVRGGAVPSAAMFAETTDRGHLARDGVSCAVCHQIADVDLGQEASFSGGWTIPGDGRMNGPHAGPHTMPMVNHTGFTPVQGEHVLDSGLCGSCHNLETHAYAPDGAETGGGVLEQAPHLEWLASSYAGSTSCQDCHLPITDAAGTPISTAIARSPMGGDMGAVAPRSPYGQHLLVGGNTLVPQLIRDWPDLLQPVAPATAYDDVIDRAREQLEQRTATVGIEASRAGSSLAVDVAVQSLAGHKLPSGIPVRRAWIELRVTDGTGGVVFHSGATDASGTLVDRTGQPLPSEVAGGPVQPHHDQVSDEGQVVIYEAVLADGAGAPTFHLMRGEGWVKDNRLLPDGWSDPDPRIVPVGVAGDPDFGPGGDTAHYTVDLGASSGPWEVRATLVYQPLATRFARELFAVGTPETAAFEVLWDGADRTPEVLGSAVDTVP